MTNSNLTIAYSNPHKRVGKLRFALACCNHESGHYVTYAYWPRYCVQHWFILRKNDPANTMILKEMQSFYRPKRLTSPA